MRPLNSKDIAQNLTEKFGLIFEGHINHHENDSSFLITAGGPHKSYGFSIDIKKTWKRLSLEFAPGTYAKSLIAEMGKADDYKKQSFLSLVNEIQSENGRLTFQVNGIDLNINDISDWPTIWSQLKISLKTKPLDHLDTSNNNDFHEILRWTELFAACILILVPLEEVEDLNQDQHSLSEGTSTKILVNKYERNRVNRVICLNFHGSACAVCKMDFERVYGRIGSGFIHVHHIIPISVMSKSYTFNPRRDLIPVCPNCHSMLHRKDPPYSIDELKNILSNKKSS